MTTTTSVPGAVSTEPAPAALDRPPRRITGRQISIVVVLALVGALIAAWALWIANERREVVVVATAAPVGTELTEGHFTTMLVTADPGAALVDADQLDDLVGRYAAAALTEGQLLAPDQVTDTALALEAGTEQIGIGLAPEQLPAEHLQAGWSVTIVDTTDPTEGAGAAAAGTEEVLAPPRTFDAVVVGITRSDTSSMAGSKAVVYLAVEADQAAAIVTLAASGNVALTLRAGGEDE